MSSEKVRRLAETPPLSQPRSYSQSELDQLIETAKSKERLQVLPHAIDDQEHLM